MRRFCGRSIDIAAFVLGLLPFVRPSDVLAGFYRFGLLGSATLQDLPADSEGPRFVFNATSLQTGADARLSRPYIADYKVGIYSTPTTTIARAVAASSGFPPFFSPVIVRPRGGAWQEGVEGVVDKGLDTLRRRMILCDGGVYDNLGLQTVGKYATVLVSDASAPTDVEPDGGGVLYSLVRGGLRVVFLMLGQLQARRKAEMIADAKERAGEGIKRAYWDIATKIDGYRVVTPMTHDNELTASLQNVRTRLNHFTPREQGQLINWGYALADAAMRRWVLSEEPARGEWPVPEWRLD